MTFKIKVEAKIGPSLVVLIWCFSEIILKKFWVYETGEGREKKKMPEKYFVGFTLGLW